MRGALAAATVLVAATPAHAGGLWIGDDGAQAMARAGAFCARADDGTAIAYNPAGLAGLDRHEAYVGLSLVHMRQELRREGVYAEQPLGSEPQPAYVGTPYPEVSYRGNQLIPFVAAAARIGPVAAAIGVFAPHAHPKRRYSAEVDASGTTAPAPQRYDILSQEAIIVLPSIAAAASPLRWLDVGVRLSWGLASIRAITAFQGQPSASEQPEQDAIATLETTDPFVFGAGVGVKVRAGRHLELGAAWSSALHVRSSGTIDVEMGALVREPAPGATQTLVPLEGDAARCGADPGGHDAGACLALDVPQTVTVGARWVLRDDRAERADVELDVRWENWSAASDYRVTVDAAARIESGGMIIRDLPLADTIVRHGLEDSWSIRLGGGASLPAGERTLHLRAGAAWDTAAAPETWTRVDLDGASRLTLAAGAGLEGRSWRLDVAGGAVLSSERTVTDVPPDDLSDPDARTQPDVSVPLNEPDQQPYHPFNTGTTTARYVLVNVGFTLRW